METELKKELSTFIKNIRQENNLTQEEMAKISGFSKSNICKMENSEIKVSPSYLETICREFNVKEIPIFSCEGGIVHMVEANTNNDNIINLLMKFTITYIDEKGQPEFEFRGNKTKELITKEVPKLIKSKCSGYEVKGSAGMGAPAEVCWVSLLNTKKKFNATEDVSTRKGIYVVVLVCADGRGFYLSLNQGFTYFQEKAEKNNVGVKVARELAKRSSDALRLILKNACGNSVEKYFIDIDLNAKSVRGKGYQTTNIASKFYDINDMPSETQFIEDLEMFLGMYKNIELEMRNGYVEDFYNSILYKSSNLELNDSDVEEKIDDLFAETKNIKTNKLDETPKTRRDKILNEKGIGKYPRDPNESLKAIKNAGYKCELEGKIEGMQHVYFPRKSNNENYTEAHHLIPMSASDDFKYSLDTTANIVSLCGTCHNLIHYGLDKDRERLLEVLYNSRKDRLKKSGINITFEKLKEYYNLKK